MTDLEHSDGGFSLRFLIDLPDADLTECSATVTYGPHSTVVSVPEFRYCFFSVSMAKSTANASIMVKGGIPADTASSVSIALEIASQIVDKESLHTSCGENLAYRDGSTVHIHELPFLIWVEGSPFQSDGRLPF
jgi:hypothetical protein